MSRRAPTLKESEKMVADWNDANQVGAWVAVVKDDGSVVFGRTKSIAYMNNGITAVIFVEGLRGFWDLTRVTALPKPFAQAPEMLGLLEQLFRHGYETGEDYRKVSAVIMAAGGNADERF